MACAKEHGEQEFQFKPNVKYTVCFRWWLGKTRMKARPRSRQLLIVLLTGLLWTMALPGWPQTLPPSQSNQLGPLPPKVPALPTVPPPAQPPGFDVPSPRPGTSGAAVTGPKIMVKEIQVVGSTAFTPQQLAEVTAPYTNREH